MSRPFSYPESPAGQGERLVQIIKVQGLSQAAFARQLGYTPQHINQIVHGKERISRECAERIAREYAVNIHWLLTGEGEMWSMVPSSPPEEEPPSAEVIVVPASYYCGRCRRSVEPGRDRCAFCEVKLVWPEDLAE
jgi:transcriptional regulator with XRE-family HTH domain